MADPILVNQIVSSLGLTGKEAESKRKELEKLSVDELNKIIANIKTFNKTDLGSFSALNSDYSKFQNEVFNFNSFSDFNASGLSLTNNTTPQSKSYSYKEKQDLDRFLADFLVDSSNEAYSIISDYNKNIGWANITDRAVNGFKVLTGQQDRIDLEQEMKQQKTEVEKLKNTAYTRSGAFESQIERKFGVPFSHQNIESLKNFSTEYTRVSAYKEKYDNLKTGFSEVNRILQQEAEYEAARKHVRGPAAASLTPPSPSSNQKFGEVLFELSNGDQKLVNEYMKKVSLSTASKNDIQKNLPEIMKELESSCKKEYDNALNGKPFSQYENQYNSACKKVFGNKNSKDIAKNFVENSKTQAAYTEIGITIATSLLLPGSSAVKNGMQKAAVKFGEKTAANAFKAGMTATMGAMPATLSTLNAATSEAGFTEEKIEEIQEKFKNGLMYGSFGAYASGPLGSAMEKILSKNPSLMSNIVSKSMGAATETTADVLFDRITSDMTLKESLEQNGIMNFGMMIAGGRISKGTNKALNELKISKNPDGTFNVKNKTGNNLLTKADETQLAGFVMAKGVDDSGNKTDIELIRERMNKNPQDIASQKYVDALGVKVVDSSQDIKFPNAPLKYNPPQKEFLDVLKYSDSKVMEKRYQKMGEVFENISQKRKSDIERINALYKTDKQSAANEFSQLLASELGQDLPAVPVRFSSKPGSAFDWIHGEIILGSEIKNAADMMKILSHEQVHVLQYKDVLSAADCEDGIVMLYAKNEKKRVEYDNALKNQLGEEEFQALSNEDLEYFYFELAKNYDEEVQNTINNDFNQKLLKNAKEHSIKNGTAEGYFAKIYEKELANADTGDDIKSYLSQLTEAEAYFLGSNKGGNTIRDNLLNASLEKRFKQRQLEFVKKYITEDNKSVALELINTEYTQGASGRHRFSYLDIGDILSNVNKNNQEYVSELIDAKYASGSSRFSSSNISEVLSLRNSAWFDKISNSQLKEMRNKFGILGDLGVKKINDEVLADLDQRICMVQDIKTKNHIEAELNKLLTDDILRNKKALQEISDLADAVNAYESSYSVYKTDKKTKSAMANFNIFIKSQKIKIDDITDATTAPEFFGKNNKRLKADLLVENQLYAMREYCKKYPDSKMSDYLYEEMYLKGLSEQFPDNKLLKIATEKVKDINKKYNTKVFLGRKRLKSADEVLKYVDKELELWKKASDSAAKMPPVIDFSSAKYNWYDKNSAHGTGVSAGYSEQLRNGAVAIAKMSLSKVRWALRHELTHTNDLKLGKKIPKEYNLSEIMPRKIEDGKEVVDFENCKFKDEFINAKPDIGESHLKYAYTNTKEFIAVAAEGDMSKYSPEFKKMLIDFGMPEWMFKLECND